jgi:two-component system NtrC family sensor kinase
MTQKLLLETFLEMWLPSLQAPVVLINRDGAACGGNSAGKQRLENGRLQAEPLSIAEKSPGAILENQHPMMHLALVLRHYAALPYPTGFALESGSARLTPFPAASTSHEAVALLEFVPESSTTATGAGAEKLKVLQEVSRAVNSSLILEDIFEALGEVLRNHIPYQEAVIVILDDTQNGIKILVRISEDGELEITGEHHGFAGYEPLMDQVLRDPNARLYTRHDLPETFLLVEKAGSALVAPLINKGVVIGLVALSTALEDGFRPEQEELLRDVSAQLAVAVENAKFYWQTQAQASREFLINQLTRSIRQSLNIEIILSTAVMELSKVMGISRCFIRYFPTVQDEAQEEMVFQYQLPGTPPLLLEDWAYEKNVFQLRREQSYNPFILNDVRDCPTSLAPADFFQRNGVKSLAIVPILIREQLAGIITLHQCDVYRAWVMEDIELLRALAEHLGVALNQAMLFQELDQQKQTLEQTLEELQQAQLYLIQSEKMAVLGQFVAGIAHEVNTPLGTILSNNATLQVCVDKLKEMKLKQLNEPAPTFPEQGSIAEPTLSPTVPQLSAEQLFTNVDNLLSLNQLAGSRIQEIVKNLRNFARLDESELKTVDVHEGIDSTILLIQGSIDPNIVLLRRYQPDLPPVQCFPGLLNQVFMNLLVNATHALQDVRPAQRATGYQPRITVETRYCPDEDHILIIVEDNGKGISPEHLAKVFDPGFTTKGAGVGTGLGLALCYRIVEKHHGRISLKSTLNQGTRFTVEIPARSSQSGLGNA